LVATVTDAVVVAPCAPPAIDGRSQRLMAAVRGLARRGVHFRLRCLILGHEDSFAREPRRLMLRCATCGRETVGWAIGPGAPVVTAPRRESPSRMAAGRDATVRVGPWTLGRREGRGEARDRQRQRLVAAASRAAEARSDEGDARQPHGHRATAGPLANDRHPERWMDVARRVRAGLGR
jgi:hypothetical protein